MGLWYSVVVVYCVGVESGCLPLTRTRNSLGHHELAAHTATADAHRRDTRFHHSDSRLAAGVASAAAGEACGRPAVGRGMSRTGLLSGQSNARLCMRKSGTSNRQPEFRYTMLHIPRRTQPAARSPQPDDRAMGKRQPSRSLYAGLVAGGYGTRRARLITPSLTTAPKRSASRLVTPWAAVRTRLSGAPG